MNSARPELRLDWCSYQAARYAVEHWHYSRRMPVGKCAKVGAWEGGRYIGAVIFSWGANRHLAGQYGLAMTECAELVRVALDTHAAPVSQIVTRAVRMLCKQSPGLRLLVSFADPEQGHTGAVYQAMNWIYRGPTHPVTSFRVGGTTIMRRAFTGRQFGKPDSRGVLPPSAVPFKSPGKHSCLYPLDPAMRAQILPLAKPYPKRASEPTGVGAGDQPEKGGSIPTRTLTTGGAHA